MALTSPQVLCSDDIVCRPDMVLVCVICTLVCVEPLHRFSQSLITTRHCCVSVLSVLSASGQVHACCDTTVHCFYSTELDVHNEA